jgi:hypothetical protein
MSALGQKQTYATHNGMSALPPKADMCGALDDVRFVPEGDIGPLAPWLEDCGNLRFTPFLLVALRQHGTKK